MKSLQVRWNGLTPLLMHSAVGVNPTHPLSIASKKLTAKRNKTEEDQIELMRLKWLLAIYHDPSVGPFIPAENVEATIREAAKKTKRGKDTKVGIFVGPDRIPLQYDGPRDTNSLYADERFRDVRDGVIGQARVLVSRPRFNHWSIEFQLEFDPTVFDEEAIISILDTAGRYIGICDYRPRYGRFESVVQ
jgi:hypothetical protein